MMQTILGSGGSIGVELARALKQYSPQVRLISRELIRVNDDDQLMKADLTQPHQVLRAVEGSDVVYLTVEFPYSYKVWQTAWPATMTHVIHAFKQHGARLVFFDNMYMYDKNHLDGMDENTPLNPSLPVHPNQRGNLLS